MIRSQRKQLMFKNLSSFFSAPVRPKARKLTAKEKTFPPSGGTAVITSWKADHVNMKCRHKLEPSQNCCSFCQTFPSWNPDHIDIWVLLWSLGYKSDQIREWTKHDAGSNRAVCTVAGSMPYRRWLNQPVDHFQGWSILQNLGWKTVRELHERSCSVALPPTFQNSTHNDTI